MRREIDKILREKREVILRIHDAFIATSHWQDAVIRQLEIIGEATNHLGRFPG